VNSLILKTTVRFINKLLLLFSVFLLLRGHNEPGGGFVGGLVASTVFILYTLSEGYKEALAYLKVSPFSLIIVGLTTAILSALPSLFLGDAFMKAIWLETRIPIIGKFGTPFVFDLGVYFLVLGITLSIVLSLRKDSE